MPDGFARHEEDDFLGDVRRHVAQPFKVAGDRVELQERLELVEMRGNRIEHVFVESVFHLVDHVVFGNDLPREFDVAIHEGRKRQVRRMCDEVGVSIRRLQRIRFGPLSLADYESHLPGGKSFAQMLSWLRNYVGYELAWDVRLVLRREEVPRATIGSSVRLGWTTWLGERRRDDDADDLVLVHETIVARQALLAH